MSEKLMELIEDLKQNGEELSEYWRERSNYWFDRHAAINKKYWGEREKRLEAEYLLREFEDAAHN